MSDPLHRVKGIRKDARAMPDLPTDRHGTGTLDPIEGNQMSMNDFSAAAGLPSWDPAKIQAEIDADLNGAGLFEVNGDDPDRKFITNVRRLAGNARTPGSRVIAFATWALFLLGAGLLYVSFEAQF